MSSGGESSQPIVHYLYFVTAAAGDAVASELRRRGFEIESRPSADEKSWLVLAFHGLSAGEGFEPLRDELEALAQRHAGEYDGWELSHAGSPGAC